jgi:hypothetical protein
MSGRTGITAQGRGAPLLVFQCQHCNTILGDSLSLIATDEELRTITLRGEHGDGRSSAKAIDASHQEVARVPLIDLIGAAILATSNLQFRRQLEC